MSKLHFQGNVVRVETARVQLPNGRAFDMEVVHHPGGAAIVAVNENQQVCLLRQYRCIFDEWFWELPAGKRDDNEDTLITAQRELSEEAGLEARHWQDLGTVVSSPGVFTERVGIYLATDLQHVAQSFDDDEIFELHWLELKAAIAMIEQGEIVDAKTIIGLYRAQSVLKTS